MSVATTAVVGGHGGFAQHNRITQVSDTHGRAEECTAIVSFLCVGVRVKPSVIFTVKAELFQLIQHLGKASTILLDVTGYATTAATLVAFGVLNCVWRDVFIVSHT